MKSTGDNKGCEVHGATSRAANKTLFTMVLASLLLICWHVWIYGPGDRISTSGSQKSFPVLLASEIWDLLFDPRGIISELVNVLPYFIAGILLAGYIRTYKIAVRMRAALARRGLISVFIASFIGILTPLCACGTLTTAISLMFAGVPLAPVMSLLVTSPLLSPSTYLLTLNDLGPEWTVIRTMAAFTMGIFAGVVTHLIRNRGFNNSEIFIEGAIPRGDFHDGAYPDKRLRCNCRENFGNRVAAKTGNMFLVFLAKSSEMLWLVGKYVLVGVAIGAVVERYMPYEWIYRLFGRKDPLNIIWVTFGSVPIFLHQISASSIICHIKSSLRGTLDGGAALAFMIGGPVTALPTMVLFWTIFKKRVFFLYLAVCIVGTIFISYAFQFFFFVPYSDMGNPLLSEVESISGGCSSFISKQSNHVRIVMDPGGKPLIALYNNDLEGGGTVVFDSGIRKFMSGSVEKYGNRKYIGNVATWLGQNHTFPSEERILVYNTFHNSGLDRNVFGNNIRELLEKKGFKVSVTDRRENPEITETLLGRFSQLWLFFGEESGEYFSAAELTTISDFSRGGRGLFIVAGLQRAGAGYIPAANKVSSAFGVQFTGYVENNDELPVSRSSFFFSRASEILGRVLKIVRKA